MNYTEEQKSQVIQEFTKRKKRQLYLVLPIVFGAIAALALAERGEISLGAIPAEAIGPVFFGVIAAAVVFSLINWRCPACSKYLGKGIPQFCPKCGVKLQNDG